MLADWSIEEDFEQVYVQVGSHWRELSGAHLLITGGTGFIGRWLLETLKYAELKLNLGVRATIITRQPDSFLKKAPHLFNFSSLEYVITLIFLESTGLNSGIVLSAGLSLTNLSQNIFALSEL